MRWCLLLVLGLGCGGGRISDPARGILELLDADGSGDLSIDEMAHPEPALIHSNLDTDGDGVVSLAELRFDLDRWDRGVPRSP